jgi:hypothetical protein
VRESRRNLHQREFGKKKKKKTYIINDNDNYNRSQVERVPRKLEATNIIV